MLVDLVKRTFHIFSKKYRLRKILRRVDNYNRSVEEAKKSVYEITRLVQEYNKIYPDTGINFYKYEGENSCQNAQ